MENQIFDWRGKKFHFVPKSDSSPDHISMDFESRIDNIKAYRKQGVDLSWGAPNPTIEARNFKFSIGYDAKNNTNRFQLKYDLIVPDGKNDSNRGMAAPGPFCIWDVSMVDEQDRMIPTAFFDSFGWMEWACNNGSGRKTIPINGEKEPFHIRNHLRWASTDPRNIFENAHRVLLKPHFDYLWVRLCE